MKFSELLNIDEIDKQKSFLLGMIYAWPIFSKDKKFLLAYSSYKISAASRMQQKLSKNETYYIQSHYQKLKTFLGKRYNISINTNLKKNNEYNQRIGLGVSILFLNDIDKEILYGAVEKWLIDADDAFKKYFLSGFMEGRGSLDFTGNYYAIDITQRKFPELAKRKLHRLNDILGMIYNYNPRILQKKSASKNDQFRINIDYYSGHYGFFRPHIIEYYENENNIKLHSDDGILFFDSKFTNLKLKIKSSNFEINEFAISLKGLSKKEKKKKVQAYRVDYFNFDTEDEILYSSYNTKEKAKANADYKCEIENSHHTFTSKSTNNNYVEAHHLIPFSKRKEFDTNIDIEENLVALCPNCHRKIHLAKNEERISILNFLFESRREKLASEMININIENLYNMYNIT